MKLNFITGGLSMKTSAGVFEASRQLALNLSEANYDVSVFGISDPSNREEYSWGRIPTRGFNALPPKRLGYSRSYLKQLLISPADLAHLQGIWMYQSAMVYKWHQKYGKPYITTIHGMLDPWAVKNAHLKKRIALMLYERTALKACSCFHATSYTEYEQVRNFGLKNPVAIIRNGICIPDLEKGFKAPPWEKMIPANKKVLLYFGRVHPKKGLANLIKAMAILKQKNIPGFEDWCLVIAGCAEKGEHEQELSALVIQNQLESKVLLLGQHFHDDKEACYFHADAFILPSYSEGMPLAALDAWAFGKYSLLTPECNLSDGFDEGVAQKIEAHPDSIAEGLQQLMCRSSEELKNLGMRARQFVAREYCWAEIAKRMSEVYQWMSGKGQQPSSVVLE